MIDLAKEKPVGVRKVAELFGVHRRTVESWFNAGLERVRVGGRVFTSLEAVQRFASQDRNIQPSRPTRRYRSSQEADADAELKRRFGI